LTDSASAAAALAHALEVTDRLRSPGGCPWDAEQTHQSLSRYLLEESYETLDAIAAADPVALREELGDLLFQVLFHARLAEEDENPFSIAEVAGDLADKLTRRHPHVFGDAAVSGSSEVEANWDAIKKAEKQRSSVTEGIPVAQPSLSLSAALLRRAAKAGVQAARPSGEDFGARLFALAAESVAAGVDPELALRDTALAYAEALRQSETGQRTQDRS
jgi:XTP/dITP diphosphohydrolase